MAVYKLTKPAEHDLFGVWRHIAGDDPVAADRVFDYLHDRCQALADSPKMGRQRNNLAPHLYVFPVGKRGWRSRYLIFYRTAVYGVEITRVLEGHRNLAADFFGEE